MTITLTDVANLRATLGTISSQGDRGQAYLDLVNLYRNNGGSTSAIEQLLIQSQITTGGGIWGGAALLGNVYAQQQAGANYNVTLDTFSFEIVERLIDATEASLVAGGNGLFTHDELQALDYSVWADKGIGQYFPGNLQRLELEAFEAVPPGSVIYDYIENLDLPAGTINAIAGMSSFIANHADSVGETLSNYGFAETISRTATKQFSADGTHSVRWDAINNIFIIENEVTGVNAAIIDPDASLAFEDNLSTLAESLAIAANPGAYEYILANNSVTLVLQDPTTGNPITITIDNETVITPELHDLLHNTVGFGVDGSGIRLSGADAAYNGGVPDLCFGEGTPILMADNTEKPIEEIRAGDMVLAFDGFNNPVPRRVVEVYNNVAEEMIKLDSGVMVTPEHPYLSSDGEFYPIKEILSKNLPVVDAHGAIRYVKGELVICDEVMSTVSSGNLALKPTPNYWHTYNFNVEGLHTYIASGLRVHNLSILNFSEPGAVTTSLEILADGTQVLTQLLPNNVVVKTTGRSDLDSDPDTDLITREERHVSSDAIVTKTFDTFDNLGNPIGEPEYNLSYQGEIINGELLGNIFGSQLGQMLAGDSVLERIAGATVGATIAGNLLEFTTDITHSWLGYELPSTLNYHGSELEFITEQSLGDIGGDLISNLQSQTVTVLSSLIFAEIADGLGIDGFAGDIFTSTGSTVTGQLVTNIVDAGGDLAAVDLLANFSTVDLITSVGQGVGAIIGSQIGAELVDVDSVGESLFASVGGSYVSLAHGTAIGSFIGSSVVGQAVGQALGTVVGAQALASLGAIILPGIGALIGAVLGQVAGAAIFDFVDTYIGGGLLFGLIDLNEWFDDEPWHYEYVGYNIETNHLEIVEARSDETTADLRASVQSMTEAYMETVNSVIDSIGGRVDASAFQPTSEFFYDHAYFGYHHNDGSAHGNNDLKVTFGHGPLYVNADGDVSKIVRLGVEYELSKMSFLGGNIMMVRAFEAWKAELNQKYADNTNSDSYHDYLADILAAGTPAQTPITLLDEGESLSILTSYIQVATQYTHYLENTAEINALIAAAPDSAFAAGWIATLLQADAMGLNDGYKVGYVANNDSAATFYDDTVITADGDDLIYADAGDDIVFSYGGADVIYGADGNDTIHSGAGADRIYADNGNDTVYGGDGIDEVFGHDGDDIIYGEKGNDLLAGENGNDTIHGGAGDDVIYTDGPGFTGNDTAHGGEGDDLIRTGSGNDVANGDEGDDEIYGDEGDDNISGGAGNDFINAGSGNDTATGGDGDDQILGYEGDDILNGDAGNDTLYGLSGVDTITGGLGNDTIYGDTGNDVLSGNEGDDFVDGWHGVDTINGGSGNDTIVGGDHGDNLDGSTGDDIIYGDRRPNPDALPEAEADVLAMISNKPAYDNFGLLYQGDDYTLAGLKAANHDMIVINPSKDSLTDVPSSEMPWTAAEIAEIQATGKTVMGYVNLAKVNSFWDDWDASWTSSGVGTGELTSSAPSWLGDYESSTTRLVDFTDAGWQALVKGRIDDMIDQGFNGTFLDDVLEYFFRTPEGLTGAALEQAISANAVEMRDFIIELRAHADAKTAAVYGSNASANHFQLIVNGAPYLLRDTILDDNIMSVPESQDYLDAIDAIMVENFFSRNLDGAVADTITFFGDNGVTMLSIDTGQVTAQQRIQIITDAVNNGFMPFTTENDSYNTLNDPFIDELDETAVAGDDHITGGEGADTIYGGGGIDTVYYLNSTVGVTVNLASNINIGGEAQGDLIYEVENISGSAHNDSLTGDNNDNWLYGNAGHDTLIGGGGNDVLVGGLGSDYIDGGTGNDTVSYASSTTFVSSDLAANNHWSGEASWDNIVNVENLVGSDFNDVLKGDANANMLIGGLGNDELHGQSGHDILSGGAGNDNIYAGSGNDIIIGGAGSDYIDGGTGIDTVSYEGSSAAVNVNLGANSNWGGDASWDSIVNVENITGSDHNDTLAGTNSANTLTGGAGNDALYGQNGDDILSGGDGNDNLYAGANNDTLIGGLGVDYLEGGAGSDTFSFTSLSDSLLSTADYIGDFVLGQDMIDVSGLGFSGITSGSGPSAGNLGYYFTGGNTVVTDGNGFAFSMAGQHNLDNDDVIFA